MFPWNITAAIRRKLKPTWIRTAYVTLPITLQMFLTEVSVHVYVALWETWRTTPAGGTWLCSGDQKDASPIFNSLFSAYSLVLGL